MSREKIVEVDFRLGGLHWVYFFCLLVSWSASFLEYAPRFAFGDSLSWSFYESVLRQLELIALPRENPEASYALLWSAVHLSVLSFPYFMWCISRRALVNMYLSVNVLKNYFGLAFATVFLIIMSFLMLCVSLQDMDPSLKFSGIIYLITYSDFGLAAFVLLPLVSASYYVATLFKTIYVHVRLALGAKASLG